MYLGLVFGDDAVKEIAHGLIPFQMIGTILRSLLLVILAFVFLEPTWYTLSCTQNCFQCVKAYSHTISNSVGLYQFIHSHFLPSLQDDDCLTLA
jgi:hypothetical protein